MEEAKGIKEKEFVATRNACKLCTPLGACLAYKGIKGCVPLIHGSQGCATYIRRYMISHFREPMDIASSNFDEGATIFGGKQNVHQAITNIIQQYKPEVLAVTTTCLSETIGDDVDQFMAEYKMESELSELPYFVTASTPSYQGTHADGFHEAILGAVKALAKPGERTNILNLFAGMFSPADLRWLKTLLESMNIEHVLLPDYSETLDGSSWSEYKRIPDGGTSVEEIEKTGSALASIQMGAVFNKALGSKNSGIKKTAAKYLEEKFEVPAIQTGWPLGVEACDEFLKSLTNLYNTELPESVKKERGRLIDAYADGHKYVFGKKAVLYGEEDLVLAMFRFLNEIGVDVVLAASGGNSGSLRQQMEKYAINGKLPEIMEDADFEEIAAKCEIYQPDLMLGHSKGYYISRRLKIPLVRIGFPIHDRLGGQRMRMLGYEGTNDLFERIVNACIEYNQNQSEVGYKYM